MRGDLFASIRAASAQVMRRARSVRIDEDGLAALAAELPRLAPMKDSDPGHRRVGGDRETLAFVLTLNAINFGSGYFPFLAKRSGLSGYLTIATSLEERFRARGSWTAHELAALGPRDCAAVLGQDIGVPEVAELMSLFATALNDFGRFLTERHGGRFERVVESAGESAEALVLDLAEMPFYRDVARYEDFDVPFYKRAQITASDLATVFAGKRYGAFRDTDRLTIFADNVVPHVLRRKRVLVYEGDLAARIEAGALIPAGSAEEVEIRAGAVHAVERCVEKLRAGGMRSTAREIDTLLWNLGRRPEMKAHPRHRTRTPFY